MQVDQAVDYLPEVRLDQRLRELSEPLYHLRDGTA